jgi:hypothetical protein
MDRDRVSRTKAIGFAPAETLADHRIDKFVDPRTA